MNLEDIREYCIKKAGVTEEFPFDEETLVFKVMGKIFLLTSLEASEPSLNLKCEPEYAIELREKHTGIRPGYHMNKKHWNTVMLNDDVPDKLIFSLIDHSYFQVVAGLSRKQMEELEQFG